MRTWLNAARSYIEPVEIGHVMRALGIGRVLEAKAPGFKRGDLVRDPRSRNLETSGRLIRVSGVWSFGLARILARISQRFEGTQVGVLLLPIWLERCLWRKLIGAGRLQEAETSIIWDYSVCLVSAKKS